MPSLSANIESKYKNLTDVTTVSFNGSPSLFFQLLTDNAKFGQANWAQVTLTYFSTYDVVTDNTGKVMLVLILYNTGNFQSSSSRITVRYLD